ncbi:hypothetical protein Tco_1464728 [Tanacetum coccineum]
MSDSEHSTVTYTSVSEDDSDIGSPGVDGPPIMPEVPPSPDYIPGPEGPPSPDYVPGPEEPEGVYTGVRPPWRTPEEFVEEDMRRIKLDYPADRGDRDDEESSDDDD